MSLTLGTRNLLSPETYFRHVDGFVSYKTHQAIPSPIGAASTEAGFTNGEGGVFKMRLDSLLHPLVQHPDMTEALGGAANYAAGGRGGFSLISIKDAGTVESLEAQTNNDPIGLDVYAEEYSRYLVLSTKVMFEFTNYEPFDVAVIVTIGATACLQDTDATYAAHKALNDLRFGKDYGMASSRYLHETLGGEDYSTQVGLKQTSHQLIEFALDNLKRQPDTMVFTVKGRLQPLSSITTGETGLTMANHAEMRPVKSKRSITVPVWKLLNSVAKGGIARNFASASIMNHAGWFDSSVPSVAPHVTHPRPAEGSTNLGPGGVWMNVFVVPKDPMRRLDMNDLSPGTDFAHESHTEKFFVQCNMVHRCRLFGRKLNLPVQGLNDDYAGFAQMQTADIAET